MRGQKVGDEEGVEAEGFTLSSNLIRLRWSLPSCPYPQLLSCPETESCKRAHNWGVLELSSKYLDPCTKPHSSHLRTHLNPAPVKLICLLFSLPLGPSLPTFLPRALTPVLPLALPLPFHLPPVSLPSWASLDLSLLRDHGCHAPQLQFSSVTQLCPTLWDPMDCSAPGLPVHHQLLELAEPMSIESVMPSSHLIPFSSCFQSFPASGSFLRSQFLASGGQSIGVSSSASVLQMNIQDWFPLGWTGWISTV